MQTVWKGAVSFGLVNVPVKMFTATQQNDIPIKMLHKELNVPIQYSRTCPKCEEEVGWSDIVKGYEYEPGHYVTFDKEELEALASESSREIRILDFVDLKEIDPIYFQKTYFLAPAETGSRAYKLLIKALETTNKIGIANVTIRSKSSIAAIRVVDGVLSMVTMFYAEEIRKKEQIPNLPEDMDVDERELEMAQMLISQLDSKFEPEKYDDEYKERLNEAIQNKIQGKQVKFAPEEKPTNVIDLMEALRASLGQTKVTDSGKEDGKSAGVKGKKSSESKVRTSRKQAEEQKTTESKADAKKRVSKKSDQRGKSADVSGSPKKKSS
ncbi:non-homologous end joining protein Ku [Cohnella kolymensis]|uniref:non-homologous end joining protein Ku n=1 Tax=Cohnella kolymensis TaxID=1590652 RepID=UPI000695FEAD|nr:Ku protein [Cohnella kolymensis]